MRKECAKIPDGREACLDGIRLLENTPIGDLKKTHKVEALGGGIFEFRCRNTPGHWIRFLLGFHPTGRDIVILRVFAKKSNAIPTDEIKLASKNLKSYSNL